MHSDSKLIEMFKDHEVWDLSIVKLLSKEKIKGQDRFYLEALYATKQYEKMIEDVLQSKYVWSIPRKYEIAKIGSSKKRVVYVHSMQDRVLLGVLNQIYSRYYKDEVNQYVFSYKEGERTFSAVQSLLKDKCISEKYGAKMDISSYFNSVSEEALHKIIDENFSEDKELCNLLNTLLFFNKVQVIDKEYGEDGEVYLVSKIIDEYASLIPGSAFSGFLANFALKSIDEWLANQEHITYARYSDDMIIFVDTAKERERIIGGILEHLKPLGLTINPDKYTYYEPGDEVTFLGLKFYREFVSEDCRESYSKTEDGRCYIDHIDIADKTLLKLKKKIHHRCKVARKAVAIKGKNADKEVAKAIYYVNDLVYRTFLFDRSRYGWAFYVFFNITTNHSLRKLDFYLINRLRYIYTGKNNSANIKKVPVEKLQILGLKSFIEMYNLFKMDKDYYALRVSEMKPVFIDQLEVKSFE